MKKIKIEYIDKTIIQKDGILGNRKIIVSKIDVSKYSYYVSIGLGYLFEDVKPIRYVGLEEEVDREDISLQEEEVKPIKRRKKNAKAKE